MKCDYVFFSGRWWLKRKPDWVSGYRPTVTYTPLGGRL